MIKKWSILGIIPARGGSKAVPRKNIRNVLGKPLIAYTIEQAKKSKTLTRVIISTEDKEIAQIAKKFQCEVPFTRPYSLATDDVPVLPYVVHHALQALMEKEKYSPDIVVVLQPTNPLRKASDIDRTVNKLIETKADLVMSVCEVKYHPFRMRRMDGDRIFPYVRHKLMYAQRQDFPKLYRINGAVYAFWRGTVFRDDFWEGEVRGVVMDELGSIDIDTELDLLFVEFLLKERR